MSPVDSTLIIISVLIGKYIIMVEVSEITCKSFEKYTNCVQSCQPYCQRPVPQICAPRPCSEGCICGDGYINYAQYGDCIPVTECPKYCTENQTYAENGGLDLATCSNRHPKKCCVKRKSIKGCFCKKGFVIEEVTGNCIKPKDCTG